MTRMTRWRALVCAVLAAMFMSACDASVYSLPLPGGPDVGDDPMTIKVAFADVLDLVPQSTVKVNDVSVGKVTAIDLDGYQAIVTLQVRNDVDLPGNAVAELRQTSLLGEKFVHLEPPSDPSSGKLSDNDVIGLDRTGRNPEVEEVFGALALLLNGGGVGQLQTIARELNTAFDGRTDEVRSVLTQIREFMGQLDNNKESIVQALENTNRLAAEARRQDGTIRRALDDVPDALRSVEVTTPGGGGDKVRYFPYRDIEPGFYKALSEAFTSVSKVQNPKDSAALQAGGISLLITPEVTTNSSSDGAFTWPPTQFSVKLVCTIVDAGGKPVETIRVNGEGGATFSEFKSNFSLAAVRASNDALAKLVKALVESPELRK